MYTYIMINSAQLEKAESSQVREFMEYMRASYPDTPLSEFNAADTYVHSHGGVETLEDDEDDE
jgi:hypothetical protein